MSVSPLTLAIIGLGLMPLVCQSADQTISELFKRLSDRNYECSVDGDKFGVDDFPGALDVPLRIVDCDDKAARLDYEIKV